MVIKVVNQEEEGKNLFIILMKKISKNMFPFQMILLIKPNLLKRKVLILNLKKILNIKLTI